MNVIIFHGMGSSPEEYWFPYVKSNLEKFGNKVEVPALPDPNNPSLEKQLPFVLSYRTYDENTILIGHSSGSALILAVLENIKASIHQAILVGGFYEAPENEPRPFLQKEYNWEKIKSHCKSFVFINSDNDPWGCDEKVGRELLEKLGGVLVIPKGEGHFGSSKFNQPYKEFPLLVQLVGH